MNIRAGITVVSITVIAFAFNGCVHFSKQYPIVDPQFETQLDRNEYLVLGDTEGTGCAQYVLGGRWPWFSTTKTVFLVGNQSSGSFRSSIPILGFFFGIDDSIGEAIFDALEKIEGADALFSVRVKLSRVYKAPFYSEHCATVLGKALQIKTDTPPNNIKGAGRSRFESN